MLFDEKEHAGQEKKVKEKAPAHRQTGGSGGAEKLMARLTHFPTTRLLAGTPLTTSGHYKWLGRFLLPTAFCKI